MNSTAAGRGEHVFRSRRAGGSLAARPGRSFPAKSPRLVAARRRSGEGGQGDGPAPFPPRRGGV